MKFAKQKAAILKRTPKIKERQIIAATSAALIELCADKVLDLEVKESQCEELKKELGQTKEELATEAKVCTKIIAEVC